MVISTCASYGCHYIVMISDAKLRKKIETMYIKTQKSVMKHQKSCRYSTNSDIMLQITNYLVQNKKGLHCLH